MELVIVNPGYDLGVILPPVFTRLVLMIIRADHGAFSRKEKRDLHVTSTSMDGVAALT
jgi:hypothetical protein